MSGGVSSELAEVQNCAQALHSESRNQAILCNSFSAKTLRDCKPRFDCATPWLSLVVQLEAAAHSSAGLRISCSFDQDAMTVMAEEVPLVPKDYAERYVSLFFPSFGPWWKFKFKFKFWGCLGFESSRRRALRAHQFTWHPVTWRARPN